MALLLPECLGSMGYHMMKDEKHLFIFFESLVGLIDLEHYVVHSTIRLLMILLLWPPSCWD